MPENGAVWNREKIRNYADMMRMLDTPMPDSWKRAIPNRGHHIPWAVLRDKLTSCFGADGWTFDVEPGSAQILREGEVERKKGKQFSVAASVSGTLVCKTPYGDIRRGAIGSDTGESAEMNEAVKNAVKNAGTNCLKRCAAEVAEIFRPAEKPLHVRNQYDEGSTPAPAPAAAKADAQDSGATDEEPPYGSGNGTSPFRTGKP